MCQKPRVLTRCVANTYTGPNDRIVEFSFANGLGGLMRFHYTEGQADQPAKCSVHLYRVDAAIDVVVSKE